MTAQEILEKYRKITEYPGGIGKPKEKYGWLEGTVDFVGRVVGDPNFKRKFEGVKGEVIKYYKQRTGEEKELFEASKLVDKARAQGYLSEQPAYDPKTKEPLITKQQYEKARQKQVRYMYDVVEKSYLTQSIGKGLQLAGKKLTNWLSTEKISRDRLNDVLLKVIRKEKLSSTEDGIWSSFNRVNEFKRAFLAGAKEGSLKYSPTKGLFVPKTGVYSGGIVPLKGAEKGLPRPEIEPTTTVTKAPKAEYPITPAGKLAPKVAGVTKQLVTTEPSTAGVPTFLSPKTQELMAMERLRTVGGYPQVPPPEPPTPAKDRLILTDLEKQHLKAWEGKGVEAVAPKKELPMTRPEVRVHKPETAKTLIEKYRDVHKGEEPPVTTKEKIAEESKRLFAESQIAEGQRQVLAGTGVERPEPQLTQVSGYGVPTRRIAYPGEELAMGGLPAKTPIDPTQPVSKGQLARGHQLAKDKLLLSAKGSPKSQYRRLALGMTGKSSMAKMTQGEAESFIDALGKTETQIVKGERIPPRIPTTKRITKPEFFERKFRKPTLAKFITPGDRYLRTLGTHDLVEPFIKAKTRMEIERTQTFKWLDKMERDVLRIEKTGIPEKIIKGFIRGRPTKTHEKWFNLLDKYATPEQAGLTGKPATIFRQLRKLTGDMLSRTNEIRLQVELPPIKNMKAYVTHIADIFAKEKLRGKFPMPEGIRYWLDYINPKHIHNPTALKRMVAERERLLRNPFKALKTMVSMDLKQIYLEYPNIMFREQMKALATKIPAETRQWTEAYVNEVIKGYPTKLDNMTNATLNRIGVVPAINMLLKPFGRALGMNPIKKMSGVIGRLVHDATIWGRMKLVIRNHTQKLLTLGLYDTKAFVKAMAPMNKEMGMMIKNNDFFKISSREFMETLPQSVFSKLEQIGFKPYGWSHISNVKFSMKVAYHAGMELVNNPKYAKYGWTKADVAKEMEYGANTTQYWYNLMGMPEIYRHGALRGLATLQSWFQNYFMKYWRELLARGFTGKAGWGKSIPPKWRVGALRHIATSLIFVEGTRRVFGLDYKRTVLLGTLPGYLSPPGQIVAGLLGVITADTPYKRKRAFNKMKYSYKAFIPGSMAWKDWWRAWEEDNLAELLFYMKKDQRGRPRIPFREKLGTGRKTGKTKAQLILEAYRNK